MEFIGGGKVCNKGCLEMVHVTVPNLKIKEVGPKKHAYFDDICIIGQNQGFWAGHNSFIFQILTKIQLKNSEIEKLG